MRSKTLFLLVFFTFFNIIVFSQKDPIKWGDIPAEDLAMTTYEQAPSAGAVVLCDFGDIYFDINAGGASYYFKRHKRVKVLNRSGFDEADIEIVYYDGQNVSKLKAQIFAPDGSVKEMGKDDWFEEKINKDWRRKKLAFPNVKEGSVLEYSYQIESSNFITLRAWYFQDFIPTRWSELQFSMIEWFHYQTLQSGTHPLVINESGSVGKNYNGYSATNHTYQWAAEHIPALKKESHTFNQWDYASKIEFQLKSINMPYSYTVPFLDTWGKIADALFDDVHFGRQYLKKGPSKKILEAASPAMEAAKTDMEKAQAAYNFVNKEMKWNDEYYQAAEDNLNDAFAKRSGNSGELNLMVLALLKAYDVKAFPVLVSTKKNGKFNRYYPMLGQFDHTLILSFINDKEYWIDAGDPTRPLGMPAMQSVNLEGLLINDIDDTFKWVSPTFPKSKEVVMTTMQVDDMGDITADISCSHVGIMAFEERQHCKDTDGKKHWESRLAERVPDASISSIDLQNLTDQNQPLKGKMAASLPGAAMVNGDIIYVSPVLHSRVLENPFKPESRTLPVEFEYPYSEQIIVNLTIPEGHVVDGAPESVKMVLPEAAGSFEYRFSDQGTKVQVICKYSLNKTFFLPEEYAALRNFHSMIEEKLGEQVVFKKRT